MPKNIRLQQKLLRFLGSNGFFTITVVLFVVEAAWIALSARYPQAFDEQFHLGITKLYAQQLSPFFSHQPAGADAFGAVARDPSYLYHYLLSFPYRWIAHFTHDVTIQVILLRLFNVALLGSSLFIFRQVLRYTSASRALINVVLFFFILTPVVPLLGSQINYDNLTIPLTGLAIWLGLYCLRQIRDQHLWQWGAVGWLVVLCMLASLVKFAFLPIFAALVLLFGYVWLRQRRQLEYRLPKRIWQRTGLLLAVVISLAMFVQMYGINTVRYHTPVPECEQVLSVQRCQAYPPWARNYLDHQQKTALPLYQIAGYPFDWLYHSMGELVFTIASGFNDTGEVDYWVGSQLILIEVISWGIFAVGIALILRYAKYLWQQPSLRLYVIVIIVYGAALGGQNFLDFLSTGEPVAIHGRYLLPILPLLYALVALAFRQALTNLHWPRVSIAARKLSVTGALMLLLLVEGGGFITYIVRSDPSWFWPQSSHAQTVNSHAQKILKPIVLDIKKKQTQTN